MKIYLYVLNTLADWEIGYITAELKSGRFLDPSSAPVEIIKVGNTKERITTMGGLSITPDVGVDDVEFNENDVLILPGADTWFEPENQKILKVAADIINQKVTVAAICGATVALASSGLLDARPHTSNDKDFLKMFCPKYAGEAYYSTDGAVADDYLITASALAPIDFSYQVFKRTNLMRPETLEAWYQLYTTKDPKFFTALMASMNE